VKYLVTGGQGFIGSHTVEALLKNGDDVTVIDDVSAPENNTFFKFENVEYKCIDINNSTPDDFANVDVVIHLAARSRIQPSFNSPRHTYINNTLGTQKVVENSIAAGVKRIVYAGSSSCYGMKNSMPYREDAPADCLNHYAVSKYSGEQICKIYSASHKIETVILRYFNVYGPREPLKGVYAPVIGIFKRQRDAGEKLTIVGDGNQSRDFTHVSDVVRANILASQEFSSNLFHDVEKSCTLNVGTGRMYSINTIAELVGGEVIHIEDRPGEAKYTMADNRKIRKSLGWNPIIKLEDVINSY